MPLSWVDAAEESSPSSQPTHADVVVLGDGVLGLSIAFALVDSRVERIVASALHQAEETLFARVSSRLPAETVLRLEALIAAGGNDDCQELEGAGGDGLSVLALIRADPGNVSLESMLTEIDKLLAVRSVGLPDGLFADVAPKVLAGGRGPRPRCPRRRICARTQTRPRR
jgi:hypothetical protein